MVAIDPIPHPRINAKKRQGRCYELAGKGIQKDPSWTLVHGRVYQALTDQWIDHAWLINGDEVYDPVLDSSVPTGVATRRIIERTYDIQEALENILRTGNWGPWHDSKTVEG